MTNFFTSTKQMEAFNSITSAVFRERNRVADADLAIEVSPADATAVLGFSPLAARNYFCGCSLTTYPGVGLGWAWLCNKTTNKTTVFRLYTETPMEQTPTVEDAEHSLGQIKHYIEQFKKDLRKPAAVDPRVAELEGEVKRLKAVEKELDNKVQVLEGIKSAHLHALGHWRKKSDEDTAEIAALKSHPVVRCTCWGLCPIHDHASLISNDYKTKTT